MISKRDSRPFLVKTPVGYSKTSSNQTAVFGEWKTLYGLIRDTNKDANLKVYGIELPFDIQITLNATTTAKQINYESIIMINDMPTENYPNGEYKVVNISSVYNGEIVLGLEKVESVDMPKLYFERGEDILFFQINYDNETKTAYIDKNKVIPFSLNSYVWTRKPSDKTSTSKKLRLVQVSDIGFNSYAKKFKKLTFLEV